MAFAATCDGVPSVVLEDQTWGRTVLQMLQSLWLRNQRCDTTLVSDDNHTFSAHSTLLAACSPVLCSSFPENTTSEFLVPLNSVSSTAVSVLLRFLYTGRVSCSSQTLADLKVAAEQLGIQHIQDFLADPIQTSNATTEVEEDIFLLTAKEQADSGKETQHFDPSFTDATTQTTGLTGKQQETSVSADHDEAGLWSFEPSNDMRVSGEDVRTFLSEIPVAEEMLTRSPRKRKKTALLLAYEEQQNKSSRKKMKQGFTSCDNSVDDVSMVKVKVETNYDLPGPSVTGKQNTKMDDDADWVPDPENDQGVNNLQDSQPKRRRGPKENTSLVTTQLQTVKMQSYSGDDFEMEEDVSSDVSNKNFTDLGSLLQGALLTDLTVSADDPNPVNAAFKTKNKIRRKKAPTSEGGEIIPPKKRGRKKREGDPVEHVCKHCGFKFKFKSALAIHELRHEKVKPFKCELCQKAYYIHSELVNHKRTHTGEKPYQCQFCGKEFYDPSCCRQHEKRHLRKMQDMGQFICQIDGCGMEFPKENERLAHEVMRHQVSHETFKCDVCSKDFYVNKELKRHIRCHEKGLACSVCHKTFARKTNMIMHERTHTGERPYKCHLCQRAYVSLMALKSHELKHSSEKQFKCEFCPKKFWRTFEKDLHERTHTNIKPYACSYCGKCYKSVSHLRVHERVHTGARPYKCETCGASFGQANTLVRHKAIHSNDRPFKCHCGKTFRRKGHLMVHEKTHFSNQPTRLQLKAEGPESGNIIQVVQYAEAAAEGEIETQPAGEGETVNVGSLAELKEIAGSEIKLEGITMAELEQAPIYIQIVNQPQ